MRVIARLNASRLNPTQLTFWKSSALWTAFLGGWGAGKTFIGARKSVELAALNAGLNGLIVAPFWTTMHRVTLAAFMAAIPRPWIVGESKKERCIHLAGGGRVFYGSADRPETLDGPTVAWAWMDEGRYVRRQGWRVTLSRLREVKARRLQGIITSTPGGEWLREEFEEQKVGEREAVHASTRENASHLARGYVESLETSLSARVASVYLDGEWGLLEGAVYESFDPRTHVIPWSYDPSLRTIAAIDFGYQRPACIFLQQLTARHRLPPIPGYEAGGPRIPFPDSWVAFDELCPEGLSTESLALQIKTKKYRIDTVYCDPAGDSSQPALGISDVEALRASGFKSIRFVTAPRLRHIPFGVGILQGMLLNVRGETRLFFGTGLKRPGAKRGIVKDIGAYHYPEAKDGRAIRDVPVKDGLTDHTCDALRYFAINAALARGDFNETIAAG